MLLGRKRFNLITTAPCAAWLQRLGALLIPFSLAATSSGLAHAADEAPAKAPPPATSPWILLPTFSNNPKLGASFGALGAYAHKFDAESKLSMFGVSAQYTSTDSTTVAIFARTSFDGDQHRLDGRVFGGLIRNDYDDYLGTGMPLKSEDHVRAVFVRYMYRLKSDWFVGAQALSTNYKVVGESALDDEFIAMLGITGIKAKGFGLIANHDSRDVLDSPTRGWVLNINNIYYSQSTEGSSDYSAYRADYKHFWSHGDRHVFAVRQNNQWTVDAPLSAYAPVRLRGYTAGEYLGKNMSSIEVEERHRFAERWTATLFAGVACLYGAGKSCTESRDRYPSAGFGVQYILKPDKGMVANLELALGKDDNQALLFKLGYGW